MADVAAKKKGLAKKNLTFRKNTWLYGTKLPLVKIIFIYKWTKRYTNSFVATMSLKSITVQQSISTIISEK